MAGLVILTMATVAFTGYCLVDLLPADQVRSLSPGVLGSPAGPGPMG
jgi:hypothetical protein